MNPNKVQRSWPIHHFIPDCRNKGNRLHQEEDSPRNLSNSKERSLTVNIFVKQLDENVVDGGVSVRRQQDRLAQRHQEPDEGDDAGRLSRPGHASDQDELLGHDGSKDGLLLDSVERPKNVFA